LAGTEITNLAGTETKIPVQVKISTGTGTEPNFGRSLVGKGKNELPQIENEIDNILNLRNRALSKALKMDGLVHE